MHEEEKTWDENRKGGLRAMNREALPLIGGLLLPVGIVGLLFLYFSGYDFILYLKSLDILYYIIIFPIGLGFILALLRSKTPSD